MPCQMLNMQGIHQRTEQLTAKIQDYIRPFYVKKKKNWKGHMYGFCGLGNVQKFFIIAYLAFIESYGTFHNLKIKEKQISTFIESIS